LKENIQQLTRQLITLNAANAGPALNRAVNEAVAATAKGAAEGDQRLRQAFDMLKANKIAEATQLLQAVAADKSASIEKDRKDVAAAYRNLGAIAGLRDPAKALEAYAKALEFDPDDRDALYWRGWLSLQAGHLAVADQNLTLLLKLASEVGDQQGIYRASLRLGDVDLLVIGATGHSALYERLVGSRADRIMQLAKCPVLIVK
jgi:nucleotide-binding universal stress UspA family protein